MQDNNDPSQKQVGTLTVVGHLVLQDHVAVGQRRAAVAEGHPNAVVDLGARHVGGEGEHVDGRDQDPVVLSGWRQIK